MRFAAGILFCVLLLGEPEMCRVWASEALSDWALRVAPVLLPFFLVLPALTSREAGQVYRRTLGFCMRPFRLPGEGAAAWCVGMLAGSPAGAAAAARMASERWSTGQLTRLAVLSSGAGPLFYTSFVGETLLFSGAWGRRMWMCQTAAGMAVALMMRGRGEWQQARPAAAGDRIGAVAQVLNIGGYMVLFGIIGGAAGHFLGEGARMVCLGLLEMTGGVQALCAWESVWRMPLMGACCCFGGASVGLQCMAVLKETGVDGKAYFGWKALQAILDAGLLFCLQAL